MKCASVVALLVAVHLFATLSSADEQDQKMLATLSGRCEQEGWACLQEQTLRALVEADEQPFTEYLPGYQVSRVQRATPSNHSRSLDDPDQYLVERTWDYLRNHQLTVQLADSQQKGAPRTASANTFLTGFGLGFLAFGLKKLLLPFFLGAQLVKSILIAVFLPTLLTSIGKFLGKSGSSIFSASAGHGHSSSDDYDFKDNFDPNTFDTSASSNVAAFTSYPQKRLDMPFTSPSTSSIFKRPGGLGMPPMFKRPIHDFKNFHKVPSTSLLLSNFDPFYSPILSRLDSVFKQMGYEKSQEECKEKLICSMYQMPAKYAPFSNLVSAQLSRDLSELHRPSVSNPDILRFFRYMKAAKEGQEGADCAAEHATCAIQEPLEVLDAHPGAKSDHSTLFGSASPPMVKTYNEINKLVQARRLAKSLDADKPEETTASAA